MKKPEIRTAQDEDEFHDSSLIDLVIDPSLSVVIIVISTPDDFGTEHLWQITFSGVLRLEYESVGDGAIEQNAPVEIYSIYEDKESDEYKRWNDRAREIGIDAELHHIVLASSFIRGWGEKDILEGITIVCREWDVEYADSKYRGYEYSRPRIDGDG